MASRVDRPCEAVLGEVSLTRMATSVPTRSADARAIVLMYHRVGKVGNAWEARYAITPSGFERHMQALADHGWQAIGIDALIDWLDGGAPLSDKAFVLTFDDGFRGVREHALPVLERFGWPCTVFVVSGLIGGRDLWTAHQNPDGRTYPLLDADEILDMQQRGVSFHSHTRSHPSLPTLADEQLDEQLAASRADLTALLGRAASYFAYPFGHLDDRVVDAVRRAGYRAAFSTQPGFNGPHVNRYRIRRLDVFGTDTPAMLLRKMRLGTNDGTMGSLLRYYIGRVGSRLGVQAC